MAATATTPGEALRLATSANVSRLVHRSFTRSFRVFGAVAPGVAVVVVVRGLFFFLLLIALLAPLLVVRAPIEPKLPLQSVAPLVALLVSLLPLVSRNLRVCRIASLSLGPLFLLTLLFVELLVVVFVDPVAVAFGPREGPELALRLSLGFVALDIDNLRVDVGVLLLVVDEVAALELSVVARVPALSLSASMRFRALSLTPLLR